MEHGKNRGASARPARLRLTDEGGRPQTLAQGPEAFVRLAAGAGRGLLLLGLGPDVAARRLVEGMGGGFGAPKVSDASGASGMPDTPGPDAVLWLESPAFAAAMDELTPGWRQRVPAHWRCVEPQEAARAAHGREVWAYRQNARLFPGFWGPVLGAVRAALLHGGAGAAVPPAQEGARRTIVLPGGGGDLLHRELAAAFDAAGFTVRQLPGGTPGTAGHRNGQNCQSGPNTRNGLATLPGLLREERPALFFSVNLRGLDAGGADFELLRACGVPVALWFVDNPWHILSALRAPWWKGAEIFVTDASFISDLQRVGARSVRHLPLACAPEMTACGLNVDCARQERAFCHENGSREQRHCGMEMGQARGGCACDAAAKPGQGKDARGDGLVSFVGRAAFPARDGFFAAAQVEEATLAQAMALLESGGRPDFHWWARRTGAPLWPGYAVRTAGLGAERCAVAWRTHWLRAALPCGLSVYGDSENWQKLLPEAPPRIFHAAVDYYTALPRIYAAAPYTLNVTSLLLPAGLTQRHFDVWAAGGFLLTDATPGLEIFPDELVREICVPQPADLPAVMGRLEGQPALRRHVRAAWQAHLRAAHSYECRVAAVVEALGLDART